MVRNNKDIRAKMTRSDSINYLKKLYALLDNLMGDSLLGIKYIRSLRKGINSLQKNKLFVDNGLFKVKVNDNKGSITIDILHASGKLIDSHTYAPDSVISEKIIGKT